MSIPMPPPDAATKDMIDKVALHVASNGPAMEQHMLNMNEPRYGFLVRGGYWNEYYEFRKQAEIHNIQQKARPPLDPLKPRIDFKAVQDKIDSLKNEIAQSESNVQKQKAVLLNPLSLEPMVDEKFKLIQKQKIDKFLSDAGLNITEFDEILSKNSWSSELIKRGSQWILQNCVNEKQKEVIFVYMLYRTKTSSLDSTLRLLVVYISDELAAKCAKSQPAMVATIGRYAPKFFAYASESRVHNIQQKLSEILGFWERDGIFDPKCLQNIRDPPKILELERRMDSGERLNLKVSIEHDNKKQIEKYEKQHADYAAHINAQIVALFQTMETEKKRLQLAATPTEVEPSIPYYNLPAGICYNMIKIEDFNYKPLKVKDIRVPTVLPISDHMRSQIDRFLQQMPESIIDEQGWEKDALKPFFEKKAAAKKQMEEALEAQGKTLEDMYTNRYKSPSPDLVPRKTRFDIKPSDVQNPAPAKSQFHYSYDDVSSELSEKKSKMYDEDDVPDYSNRGGFGSEASSSGNKPAPMFGKPISFSLSSNRQ